MVKLNPLASIERDASQLLPERTSSFAITTKHTRKKHGAVVYNYTELYTVIYMCVYGIAYSVYTTNSVSVQ